MGTRVAICVATFRRPGQLRTLLESLEALEDPGPGVDVKVVVVDNDPAGSASAVVEELGGSARWPIHYAVEPRQGIAFVRNRAVEAAGDVDSFAFIDDDEVPEPAWLAELIRVQQATGADVVTGAVVPTFETVPPPWMVRGGFHQRPRFPTGHRLSYARTGNALITSGLMSKGHPPFNEALALSGGEDTHFFMRAWLGGATIVWADDAVVSETVPNSRLRLSWLVRREYRRGNTLSLCLRDLTDSWPRRIRRVMHGVLQIGSGCGWVLLSVARGRITLVRGLQRMALGAGMLTGLLGLRFDEYAVTHARDGRSATPVP